MPKNKEIMASLKRDKTIRKVNRMYWILGIIVVVSTIVNMIIQNIVYINTVREMSKTIQIVQTMLNMEQNFGNVNKNVLLLIESLKEENHQKTTEELLPKITSEFSEIDKMIVSYNELNVDSSETMHTLFSSAVEEILKYETKITEISERLETMTIEEGMSIYTQELEPSQTAAIQKLQSVISTGENEAAEKSGAVQAIRGTAQFALIAMLIATIVLLIIIGKSQVGSIVEIRQKEQELTEVGNRLTRSRKKLVDSAMTNILTGMKNRYALDENLSQLIGNAQFNIAVFDIDNFRAVNDMYGYEFGDEYLSAIAEMLKNEYSEYAEMFNITGNEFCMVFHEHVSDLQAQQLTEQIRQGIGQPIMVAGIPVQTTVSSSLYHYLPSDNLDVNTLLMKVDSALHAAKRDGGNRLYQIQ